MRGIDQLLQEHPFFAGLGGDALTLVAGCAVNRHVDAGTYLYREGDPAETFFVIRRGRIAIEVHSPTAGSLVIETLDAGEVLGWSWLVPPFRWQFDARAVDTTDLMVIDGACLRGKCDDDPVLGYALMQRVAHVMLDRLQATRVRLLDLYGAPREPAR